jgi:hypothetical protein
MKNLLTGLLMAVSLAFTAFAAPPPDNGFHLTEVLEVDNPDPFFLEAQSGSISFVVPGHYFSVAIEPACPVLIVAGDNAGYPSGLPFAPFVISDTTVDPDPHLEKCRQFLSTPFLRIQDFAGSKIQLEELATRCNAGTGFPDPGPGGGCSDPFCRQILDRRKHRSPGNPFSYFSTQSLKGHEH